MRTYLYMRLLEKIISLPGWGSWVGVSSFTSQHGCCCIFEWINISSEPSSHFLVSDCKSLNHIFWLIIDVAAYKLEWAES